MLAGDPTSVIRVVLAGGEMPTTLTAPSNLGMPPFAWRLSDDEVAALVTFIRGSFGNAAPPVAAAEVQTIRGEIEPEKARTSAEIMDAGGAR